MVTATEAYKIFKAHSETPIIFVMEGDEYFCTKTLEKYLFVRKDSGEVTVAADYVDFIFKMNNEKFIMVEELFDDFMEYYKENTSEQSLAQLYALVWNNPYYYMEEPLDMYRSENEKQLLKTRWTLIEQKLYSDIRNIIDNEEINYPPCVLNKFDDPFYRIKPFMLRNGWTDNATDRTWVIYK